MSGVTEKSSGRIFIVKGSAPLIIETHPTTYDGLPFVTLIQYRNQPILTIVDNVLATSIKAYVLDLCGPEGVDGDRLIEAASEWHNVERGLFPVSVSFSRRGMTPTVSRVYKTLNVEFVSRIIGPIHEYPVLQRSGRRRRKCNGPITQV